MDKYDEIKVDNNMSLRAGTSRWLFQQDVFKKLRKVIASTRKYLFAIFSAQRLIELNIIHVPQVPLQQFNTLVLLERGVH